jgi:hypothetical protein
MHENCTVQLSPQVWSRISQAAQAEGKAVDELIEEAALRLLQERDLRSFVAENRELASQHGLTEADVPRLIAETREERSRR